MNEENISPNFEDIQTVAIYNSVTPHAENFRNILMNHKAIFQNK